jgi:Ca-activated chloride channel family protein
MRIRLVLAIGIIECLAVFLCLGGIHREAIAQDLPYRYDVKVELVGLYATVLDRSGKLVTHLNQHDFVLYDDGKPQAISLFSREYIPMSIVLLLDTSGSMDGEKLDNARKSLLQFLKSLNRGDEVMLMEFRAKPRVVQPFSENFSNIERDLRHLEGNGSTALYDAILAALNQVKSAHNRRRAVLLVSDGINTYGKARLEDTVVGLRQQGIELYAIGLETELPEEAKDRLVTRTILDRLTQSAGGESFIISDSRDLKRICAMISDQMHNQYSFGYYPPKTMEGEWRTIRLETKARGFRVIASKAGYYASSWGPVPSERNPNSR